MFLGQGLYSSLPRLLTDRREYGKMYLCAGEQKGRFFDKVRIALARHGKEEFMLIRMTDEVFGKIEYEESLTGRKTLIIDGVPLTQTDKKTFRKPDGTTFTLNGSYMSGVTLISEGREVCVSMKTKWYEYVLAFLPFAIVCVWGNNPALVAFVPMVGGVIGGVVSALVSVYALLAMKKSNKVTGKILIGLIFAAMNLGACILIGYGIVSIAKRSV